MTITEEELLAGLDNDIDRVKKLWETFLVPYRMPKDAVFKYWLRHHSVSQCGHAFDAVQWRLWGAPEDFAQGAVVYEVTDCLMDLDIKVQDELEKRIAELNAQHQARIEELRAQHRELSKRWRWPIKPDMRAPRKRRTS